MYPSLINTLLQKIPAKQLNFAYQLFSNYYQKKSRINLIESFIPRILPTQKQIEEKAVRKLAQVLGVIKMSFLRATLSESQTPLEGSSERQEYRKKLVAWICEMLSQGQLERNGSAIFLRDRDIASLASLLQVQEEFFRRKAGELKILRSIIDDPMKLSYLHNEQIEISDEQYTLQHYRVITKDGMVNDLTMLIDDLQVTPGDKRPSVILVPGIACSSNAFYVSAKYALARDLARRGYWVYLFEPRGMGRNRVAFDVDCTLDTLIDDDLPSVIDFVHKRSKGKPVMLLGHSMGGMVAEFMLQMWSRQGDRDSLSKVKGLITLGAPKQFDKNRHLFYPMILWLNYILPFLKVDRVPLREIITFLCKTPGIRNLFSMAVDMDFADMNFLINPDNLSESDFMFQFIRRAVGDFSLGIGFQFQKAIYTGKGISRMDHLFAEGDEKYSYTKNVALLDPHIPLVHFLAEEDPLAPPDINNFQEIYRHTSKKTVILGKQDCGDIVSDPSQVNYFIVPRTKHIDILYGKTASRWVYPLVFRAIDTIW
jgi:pimeloyl-ACP methyl ester carboxylesterase